MLLFSCFSFKSRLIHIFSMISVSGSFLCIVPLNFNFFSFFFFDDDVYMVRAIDEFNEFL